MASETQFSEPQDAEVHRLLITGNNVISPDKGQFRLWMAWGYSLTDPNSG